MKKAWFALLLTACVSVAVQVGVAPIVAGPEPLLGEPVGKSSGGADALHTAANPMTDPIPETTGVVHIILLGTDHRPPDEGWRTDVMIIVSIDLEEETVSLVSIPRDIYVAIPGHGKTRLNLADNIGEGEHFPGGGPALLRAKLEESLGLTFSRYIRIDFQGFVEMIDALGGIDVDVACPTELWVPNMKSPGEYLLLRTIPAGMQHMNGELALMYSRCRAHTPVFDRDRRQREVLLAIRNRVLELGVPGLLPRVFELLDSMAPHVQTDLQPAEIVALAQLAWRIPAHNISQRMIDQSVAQQWTTPEGSWVMLPDRPLVKELVAERLEPASWEERSLADEGAPIAVDNGTTIEGFASQVADRLRSRGYRVEEVGKAAKLDHRATTIISYGGPSFTLDRLREYLGVGEESIQYEPDWQSSVAIRVIVGSDAQRPCR